MDQPEGYDVGKTELAKALANTRVPEGTACLRETMASARRAAPADFSAAHVVKLAWSYTKLGVHELSLFEKLLEKTSEHVCITFVENFIIGVGCEAHLFKILHFESSVVRFSAIKFVK